MFQHVRPLLEGDLVIGNAEGLIAERRQPYFELQRWSYNAEPEAAEAPAEVGCDALGLLNNHAYARGREGLDDTVRHLEPADVEPFGAGVEGLGPLVIWQDGLGWWSGEAGSG